MNQEVTTGGGSSFQFKAKKRAMRRDPTQSIRRFELERGVSYLIVERAGRKECKMKSYVKRAMCLVTSGKKEV